MTPRNIIFGSIIVLGLGIGLFLLTDTECCAADITGQVQDISPTEYQAQFLAQASEHILVDVRTPAEFAQGHIEGAVNIPLDALPNRLSELPQDQPIVVYCQSGNRSSSASQLLSRSGYTDLYDLGGIIAWAQAGMAIR